MKFFFLFFLSAITMCSYAQKKPAVSKTAPSKTTETATEPAFYTNNFTKKLSAEELLDCNALTDLGVIVPITAEMKKYDRFNVLLYRKGPKDGDDFTDYVGGLAVVYPDSKEYQIEYANKKELRFVLYNKQDSKKEFSLFYTNPKKQEIKIKNRFIDLFCFKNYPFRVCVYGGLENGYHYNSTYEVMEDDYKYKLLSKSGTIANLFKVNANEFQFSFNDNDSYILSLGGGNTFTTKPNDEYMRGGDFTTSNGLSFNISIISPSRNNIKDELAYRKQNMIMNEKKLTMEKEGDNYFIYTYKEIKLIGKRKTLSTGFVYLIPTADNYFIQMTSIQNTITIEECEKIVTFLKDVTVKKK